jgi:glycosyltransferase involved in cell wall biosynthesis
MTKGDVVNSKLVTIIIPTIGRPHYIIDTIRSTIEQSYKNLEILISENDTQIKTMTLLESSKIFDSRIKIISTFKQLDFAEHMNFCINNASGYYVMILSDDDQITRGYVEEMVGLLESCPSTIVSLGRQFFINENDKGQIMYDTPKEVATIYKGIDFLKGALTKSIQKMSTYVSLFAKKKDILSLGAFKSYPYGAHSDNYLFLNLAFRGNVALGKSYLFYRIYPNSVGLGMPFLNLLLATKKYQQDILRDIDKLYNLGKISSLNKKTLWKLIKSQNGHMILSRTFHIYRKRVSFLKFLYYMILSSLFSVLNKF